MRTFEAGRSVMTAMAVLLASATLTPGLVVDPAHAAVPRFTSPQDALKQGISAFRGGYYEIAIPALEHAAENNIFLGQFFLARLYADNRSAHTDHAKAYMLFQQIANDHADADPDDMSKAPYVAHALTELADYVRLGLPEIGVKPNASRAASYLHHAAIFFNHEDAQFELAKLQLKGEGVPSDVARGKHWLAILAQKGHAGAQAFLADLYARGLYVKHDAVRALTLISVAVKNAPDEDRVWIEDTYQNIYCGASKGVRKQVGGMVAEWDQRYGRRPQNSFGGGLGTLNIDAVRTCQNGDAVPVLPRNLNSKSGQLASKEAIEAPSGAVEGATPSQAIRPASPSMMQGGAASGLRSVGERR